MDNLNNNNNEIHQKTDAVNGSAARKQSNFDRLDEEFFAILPNVLINDLRDDKLKSLDLVVYAVYVGFRGKKKECWPGNKRVACVVGTSVRNLGRCIDRLKSAGHISRKWDPSKITRVTCLQTRVENHKVIRSGQLSANTELKTDQESTSDSIPMTPLDIKSEPTSNDEQIKDVPNELYETDSLLEDLDSGCYSEPQNEEEISGGDCDDVPF